MTDTSSDPFAWIPDGQPTPGKPQTPFDHIPDDESPSSKIAAKVAGTDPFAAIPENPSKVPTPSATPTPAPKPSVTKRYWDGAKSEFTDLAGNVTQKLSDFKSDVKSGYGNKNPWELMKTESLPAHLVQGAKRLINGEPEKPKADKTDPGMIADLKALGITAKDHPGVVIGSLVKSIASDPELVLPWLWQAIPEATAVKVAQAARAMGASVDIAKAAEAGGMIAGRAAMGGAVGAAVEGADQFSTGQYDANKVGSAAAEGAVLSTPGRLGVKERGAPHIESAAPTRHDEAVAAGVAEPIQGELPLEEAQKLSKVPDERLTSMDMTRESLAQAVSTDPINLEMIQEVAKEPIRSPTDGRDRLVKALKQATVGSAIGAGVGYAVANHEDADETTGAEMGLILGAGLPLLKARRYTGPDVSELINARNGQVKVVAKAVYAMQNQIEKAVPDKAARERLSEMIDHGVEPEAGTPEHEAHQAIKQANKDLGEVAVKEGVIESLRENYISHIVEEDPATKAGLIQKLFGTTDTGGGPNKGGASFGKERKYDTFEDLQAALKGSGLRLKTKDASEIMGIYANAVYKSVADKRLVAALKETKFHDGSGLMVPVEGAPRDYVSVPSMQLAGVKVHPDIAPDLQFIFSHSNPNWLARKLQQVTSITKRISVSTSLFHAKTLIDAYMGSEEASLRGLGNRASLGIMSARKAMKMYKEGGNNEGIDRLLKNGMQIGTPEDVAGHEIQHGLDAFADVLDKRWPLKYTVGAAVKGLSKIDKWIESATFGTLQTGFKIHVGLNEMERLIGKGLDPDRAAKLASSLVNDLFGSLDYYRVATDTDSHIMRKLGTGALNTNSRKVLQLALFAPDWTIATFRSLAKGLPGGTTDEVLGQMHRRYMIKSAVYYFAVGGALNQYWSGHPIWQNKNPTRLDYGDGRTMQFSKHDTEPMEWLRDPVATGTNKLGFVPGTIYKTAKAHADAQARHKPAPTPFEDVGNIAKGMEPISIQQFVQNGMSKEALLSFIGMPVYGTTDAQKAEKKEQAAEKRREKRAENEPQN